MPHPLQTYATHRHNPKLTAAAGLLALLAMVLFLIVLVRQPSVLAAGLLSLAIAVMCLVVMSRVYTTRLQDRIIRLEMRTRIARLLPHREADFARLSTPQIVALRFASDAELPALMDRALAEKLTADQIKRAVKDWQADYYRT